ncbi:MAG TPA: serine/threonine-protein kinase [Polyangiaceae bacterium]|nr:serine/threonine-protein kinase [Polyangiaceae bacterium]
MNENHLNQYRVIAQLGRGGMSDVYLAASYGTGGFAKLLVLKVLGPQLAREPQFLAMFRDEARLAARLNHPNVVQTYEVGESGGRHFIAMEYLEGQSLNRIVERLGPSGRVTPALALRVVIDALGGLHYAHELHDYSGAPLGVVHRDITPQNLFVTYEGQTKVVDFGIAKATDSTTETTVGTVKGKVAYMAPEQARGEIVDRRADVFSMGVVLWELLSGRRFWEGLTDVALIGKLVSGAFPQLRQAVPEIHPALEKACMRALASRPEERPQTAAEMQAELESALEQLKDTMSQRRLGELLRTSFAEERGQVSAVVGRQLERLARQTPSGETPPGGLRLPALAGDMPILGEGSTVHDAVTRLHTGLTQPTNAAARSYDGAPLSTGTGQVAGVRPAGAATRGLWIGGMLAVGAAGLALGVTRPWEPRAAAAQAPLEAEEVARPAAAGRAPERPAATATHDCKAARKPLIEITGELSNDATLTCDREYLIRFTATVTPGTTLTIEPGTTLRGDAETRGVLLVQPGGRLMAEGTPELPIVFTSDRPVGQRKAGDWGGIVVLGQAPINLRDGQGNPTSGRVEGLSVGGEYGGTNPEDSSGVLRYLRIEFGGTEIAPNNEVNGLTLAGVGRGTRVDHIQVRHTADDCFEFFGGTVDARHLICVHPDDDAFDWDYGYTGRLQFLVAQSTPEPKEGAHGFEGDNDPGSSTNTPISSPTIYNATLCGKNRALDNKEHYGVLLRRGTHGRLRNLLVTGFGAALDVQDGTTRPNFAASTLFNNGVPAFAEVATARRTDSLLFDDDKGFDELLYLNNPGLKISSQAPELSGCFDADRPNFKPREAIVTNAAAPDDDGFFDTRATYVGAFRDRDDSWDRGNWVAWDRP